MLCVFFSYQQRSKVAETSLDLLWPELRDGVDDGRVLRSWTSTTSSLLASLQLSSGASFLFRHLPLWSTCSMFRQ